MLYKYIFPYYVINKGAIIPNSIILDTRPRLNFFALGSGFMNMSCLQVYMTDCDNHRRQVTAERPSVGVLRLIFDGLHYFLVAMPHREIANFFYEDIEADAP